MQSLSYTIKLGMKSAATKPVEIRTAWSIILVVILLALAPGLRAEPVKQLHPTNYVNDFAHVLDQSTITQLDDICLQIEQKAHAQIAVVTIDSTDGEDIESYAVDLFKQWGVGSKSTNHGVLILVAVKDHHDRTEVGYGLEPILPDGKVGGFGREAVPLLRAQDYNGAISLMTERVADVIAQDAGITLTGSRPSIPERGDRPDSGMSPGGVVLLIVVVLVVLLTPLRRVVFWWLLLGGGGRGGFGGGGFGGGGFGGGGGGFGGFGGGSSGGGGASGSW